MRQKVTNKCRRHDIPRPFAARGVKARLRPGVSVRGINLVLLGYKMVAGHAYSGNSLKKVEVLSTRDDFLYPLSDGHGASVALFKCKNSLEYRNNLRMAYCGFEQYFEGLIERVRVGLLTQYSSSSFGRAGRAALFTTSPLYLTVWSPSSKLTS